MMKTISTTLGLLTMFAAGTAAAGGPTGAVIRTNGTWNRFTTGSGADVNVKLQKATTNGYQGKLIIGPSEMTGDKSAFKGGAQAHSLDLTVQQKSGGLHSFGGKMVFGANESSPFASRQKYQVTLSQAQGATGDQLPFSGLRIQTKAGALKPWQTVFDSRGLSSQPNVTLDRAPIRGDAAKEIYRLLEDAGAPNVDIDGTDYRGLRLSPYLTQSPGQHFEVSFDSIEVRSQLVDALNGLKSLGLRPDHPIFTRLK